MASPNWLRMILRCCAILLTVLLCLWGMGQAHVVLASPSAQEAGPTMGPLQPLPPDQAAVGAALDRLRSDQARLDRYSTVTSLLGAGAHRALRDSQGKTAFELAGTPEKKELLQP